MKACRECGREVSDQAFSCPGCGAPYPARTSWDGWGYEYRSSASIFGVPLLHVSFKFRPNKVPVPAKGIIAVGQFACGVLALGQFTVGLVCVGQFAAAMLFALAQIGIARDLIAQLGIFFHQGKGQLVIDAAKLFFK